MAQQVHIRVGEVYLVFDCRSSVLWAVGLGFSGVWRLSRAGSLTPSEIEQSTNALKPKPLCQLNHAKHATYFPEFGDLGGFTPLQDFST